MGMGLQKNDQVIRATRETLCVKNNTVELLSSDNDDDDDELLKYNLKPSSK
jgi:hypothetical protein